MIMEIIENNSIVSIDRVKQSTFNFKRDFRRDNILKVQFEKLKISIRIHGQMAPVQVRELDSEYEIIHGNHTWLAMNELGCDKIEIKNLGKMSDAEAIAKALSFAELNIPVDFVEAAKLVKDLYNKDKYIKGLPYSGVEILNKIELLNFDWSQFEDELESENIPNTLF